MNPQQPHTLPEGWEYSTVGKSTKICNTLRFPISEEERQKMQGKYPYYGPTKIQDYLDHYRIEGRYALIGEDGDHFLKYREQQMTLLVDGQFNVNNHAHLIQGTSRCTTEWFYYYFAYRDLFSILTRQGAGRYKLTKDSLERLPILLPPLPEQRQIAAVLGTWDRAIEQTTTLLKQLRTRHRGLMQRLLTGKVRLPGFDAEWQAVKLGDVFKERSQIGYHNLPLLSITAELGVINRDELVKRDTSNEDKSKYKRICPGDIGYNTMRMWQGRSAVSSLEGIVSPAYTIVTPKSNADVQFMGHLFKFPDMIHRFYRNSQGLVDDTLNCKFPEFAKVRVTIPPTIEEQRVIAQVLDASLREIRQQEAKLDALRDQKRGLMQCLLTGRVRVR